MATFTWQLDTAGAAAGDETTVTTGNAGTDGPTGVNSVTGGTRVFDNATAPTGATWAVRLATGATSGTSNMVWDSTRVPDTAQAYFRIPFHFSSLVANRSICRVRGGGTQILRVHYTSDGRLELRNSANSVAATGTVAMPEDQWIEIGIFADPGNTSTCALRWWLWGAAAADFEDEVSVSSNFSTETTVNEITIGNIAAGANIPNYWVGAVRYDSAGWLGPASVDATATPSVVAAVASIPAATVSAGAAATPAAVAAVADIPAATVSATGLPLTGLFDDFNDNSIDTAKWPANYGSVAETGGRARVDCDTAQWSAYKSGSIYTLTGSQASARMYPPSGGSSDGAYSSLLVTSSTPGTDAGFLVDAGAGVIGVYNRVGFSDAGALFPTYNATDHAYLRVREASGTLHWESSPDGAAWTSLRTESSPSWVADGDLALILESHRTSGTDNFAEYDDVNVISAAVTPATVAAAASVPAAAASAGATITATTVEAATAVPAPTPTAGSAAQPATVAAAAAVPAPGVEAGSVAAPVTVAAAAAVRAPTPAAGAVAEPDAVTAVAEVPAPTVEAGGSATATPDPVAAVAAVPAPTLSAGSAVAPVPVAAVAEVPTPAVAAGSAATPNPVAAVADVPAAAPSAASTATPATVAAVSTVGAPTVTAGSTATPAPVAATAAAPSAAASASSTATLATLAVVTVIPAPTTMAGSAATPVPVAALATVPAAGYSAGVTPAPSPVVAVATVPQATATAVVPTVPGIHAPGSSRPALAADATRPSRTPSAGRPALTASTNRG